MPSRVFIMKVALLINRGAGALRHLESEQLRVHFGEVFRNQGMEIELLMTNGAALASIAQQVLTRARTGDVDAIVIAGGDGSVGTVAGVVADAGVPLGVLPLGTLNHFARDLGIPLDLASAVALIGGRRILPIDVGEVNGRVFVNNSSIGIYPYMLLDRRRRERQLSSKWIAAGRAFVRALRDFPYLPLEIKAEGRDLPCRTACLFVGNNNYQVGSFGHLRREQLDRGELFLLILHSASRLSLLRVAIRMALGLYLEDDVIQFQAPAAEVLSPSSRLPVSFDGEVASMRTPLLYRSRAKALLVFGPAAIKSDPNTAAHPTRGAIRN